MTQLYPTSTVTLAGGDTHEVTPANPDMCRLELFGEKEGMSLKTTPIAALTFTAWAVLSRTGVYNDTWPNFRDRDCLSLEPHTDDEVDAEADETPKL